MRVDDHNRIRFTRDGVRFVVTNSGVRAYERDSAFGFSTEYAMNRDRTARAVLNNIDEIGTARAILALSSLS